ncbi:dual specificity protein phosphatase family protein [Sulfurospirillum sp. 1612]|uniref:dual specificity protein phosphatase family protein n=1 Tax=Sulfurospirillum sp. 1612 TaxID=3094835 RepID=UPI002F946AED
MQKIANLNIYVGTKEEYHIAISQNMKIVCALNRANGFVTHQSQVGWTGRGCNKDNPYYLYKEEEDAIYLNMFDGEDPIYVNDKMIDAALSFMKRHLDNDETIFVHCSLGESRSPSISLMYMLEHNLIDVTDDALRVFRDKVYGNYQPKRGNAEYIIKRWLSK